MQRYGFFLNSQNFFYFFPLLAVGSRGICIFYFGLRSGSGACVRWWSLVFLLWWSLRHPVAPALVVVACALRSGPGACVPCRCLCSSRLRHPVRPALVASSAILLMLARWERTHAHPRTHAPTYIYAHPRTHIHTRAYIRTYAQ